MSKPWAFVGLSLCAGLVSLGTWSAVQGQAAKLEGGSADGAALVIREPAPREMTANERKIREALSATTELKFVETDLREVADFLSKQHGIPILLDSKALDDAGVGSDTPITFSLRGVSLASALKLMLHTYDLTYVPENEVLLLTTNDEAGQRLSTRVYDVRDLMLQQLLDNNWVLDDDIGGGSMWDYDSLIELITSTVGPSTWDAVGGPGSIAPSNGTLVLSQTEAVHDEVAALLAELRRVRKASGPLPVPRRNAPQVDAQGRTLSTYRIVMAFLALKADMPVTGGMGGGMGGGLGGGGGGGFFSVSDRPVDSPLAQIGSGGLGGGKPEATPAAPGPQQLVEPFPAVQELAATISATVEPGSWKQNGGVGTIRAIPSYTYNGAAGTLVILQTPAVHAKIKKFLEKIGARTPGFFTGAGC